MLREDVHRGDRPALRTRTPAMFAEAMVVGRFAAHTLRSVKQFAWLEAGPVKAALSRPTHQYPAGAYTQGASRTQPFGGKRILFHINEQES
jgi:hypothetical protein